MRAAVLHPGTPDQWPWELRRAAQGASPAVRDLLRAAYAERAHARQAVEWATGADLERALEAVQAAEARWQRLVTWTRGVGREDDA